MKKILLPLSLLASLLIGCAGSGSVPGTTAVQTNLNILMQEKSEMLAQDKYAIVEVGEGIASREQIALNKADMQARAAVARTMKLKSQELRKDFYEEVGEQETSHNEQVIEQVTSEMISGATVVKSLTEMTKDGSYKVTVLMVVNANVFEKMMKALNASDEVANKVRARVERGYAEAEDRFEAYDKNK